MTAQSVVNIVHVHNLGQDFHCNDEVQCIEVNVDGVTIIRNPDGTICTNPDNISQGPKGDKGDPGPAGADGKSALDVFRDYIGDQNATEEDMMSGLQGPAGPKGADGAQGIQGPAGADGAIGPIGPQGDRGIQGIKGDKGEKGEVGPVGPQGAVGPKGKDGKDGKGGYDVMSLLDRPSFPIRDYIFHYEIIELLAVKKMTDAEITTYRNSVANATVSDVDIVNRMLHTFYKLDDELRKNNKGIFEGDGVHEPEMYAYLRKKASKASCYEYFQQVLGYWNKEKILEHWNRYSLDGNRKPFQLTWTEPANNNVRYSRWGAAEIGKGGLNLYLSKGGESSRDYQLPRLNAWVSTSQRYEYLTKIIFTHSTTVAGARQEAVAHVPIDMLGLNFSDEGVAKSVTWGFSTSFNSSGSHIFVVIAFLPNGTIKLFPGDSGILTDAYHTRELINIRMFSYLEEYVPGVRLYDAAGVEASQAR